MRAAAWWALAVLASLATLALVVGAFTRFDDGPPPRPGDPGFVDYQEGQYAAARRSAMLGVLGAFAFLAAAACAQKAWRRRARP